MTQQFQQQSTPDQGGADTSAGSLNPATAQSGNVAPEDFEAGVRQDQQNTLDTLNGVRGQIKSTTGAIQDAVPGGK